MTTVYPTSEDSFDRPSAVSPLTGHAALHDDLADAIEAIQNKVGVDNSTDATSIDYKLAHLGDTYYTETEVDAALATKLGSTAKAADSEKLDNLNSTQFLRSDADDTTTGTLTVGGTGKYLRIKDTVNNTHTITFATADLSGGRTITFPNASGTVALTSDFSGASVNYASSAGSAGNAGTLDNIDSTQFLRSDTADIATGLITFYRPAGSDWTDATAIVGSANEQCSLALRGGSDSTTYDKNTIQLRPANTGGASPQPLLYMQNHNNTDQANIQVKSIYYSGSLYPVSSLTVKNTIQDYDGATAVIDSLRPVTFFYNASPDMGKQVGLIAEEVQAVDPMFVAETDVPSLNLNSIVGLAIAGLQEANTRITELEAKVAELEGR